MEGHLCVLKIVIKIEGRGQLRYAMNIEFCCIESLLVTKLWKKAVFL